MFLHTLLFFPPSLHFCFFSTDALFSNAELFFPCLVGGVCAGGHQVDSYRILQQQDCVRSHREQSK